jgi:hypothetical protein
VERLRHQGVVGDLAFAHQILGTGDLVGENDRQPVLSVAALGLRRHLAAVILRRTGSEAVAFQRQRVPKHRVQQGLQQHVTRSGVLQPVLHFLQREDLAGAKRQHDALFQGAGLQLDVELAAHALAQGQSPGFVDAGAVGRVDHQVGVSHFVDETFEHEVTRVAHLERCPEHAQMDTPLAEFEQFARAASDSAPARQA